MFAGSTERLITGVKCLQSTTSSTAFNSGGVGRNWGDVFDSADLHFAGSGQSSDGVLGTWSWGLGGDSSFSSELDVEGVDADLLELDHHLLGGKHGCVWR